MKNTLWKLMFLFLIQLITLGSSAQAFKFVVVDSILDVITPRYLVAEDFNNDGIKDLAYTCNAPGIKMRKGNGNFSFSNALSIGPYNSSGNNFTYFIESGNINSDPKSDIMVSEGAYSQSGVRLLGNISSSSTINFTPNGFLQMGSLLAVKDMNNDGDRDIVIFNRYTSPKEVKIYFKSTAGITSTPSIFTTTINTSGGIDAAIADFNNDGLNDIVFSASNKTEVWQNNGDSTFTNTYNGNYTSTGIGELIYSDDFDNDGKIDLLTTGYYTPRLCFIKGNGNCTFVNSPSITAMPNQASTNAALYDFDQDGKRDVVVVQNDLTFWKNMGNGKFQYMDSVRQHPLATGPFKEGITLADFNNDGQVDIAASATMYSTATGLDDRIVILTNINYVDVQEYFNRTCVIFPNPTDGVVTFSCDEARFSNATIDVSNMLGQIVSSVKTENDVDFSEAPSGLYSLRVSQANGDVYYYRVFKK